jgi:hypothetical protein
VCHCEPPWPSQPCWRSSGTASHYPAGCAPSANNTAPLHRMGLKDTSVRGAVSSGSTKIGPDVAQEHEHRAAEKVNCRPLEHPVGSLAASDMQESCMALSASFKDSYRGRGLRTASLPALCAWGGKADRDLAAQHRVSADRETVETSTCPHLCRVRSAPSDPFPRCRGDALYRCSRKRVDQHSEAPAMSFC